ncbi:MAG TPA: hypothetical protein VFW15_06050, partial [Thermoanaerobaculia bacterium]|nr:hypothetical protein [Thermoanaerobaculia bacterium]
RKALRAEPGSPVANSALWSAYYNRRMYKEALAQDRAFYADDREMKEALERGYAEHGYEGAMRRSAATLSARFRRTYALPTEISRLYMAAGDRDRALEWLEKGYEERDPNMPYLGLPEYDGLRSDPRFRELLRRMKLPT